MKLFLAPMEGVVDWSFRDLLSQIGGFDLCVTEFLRVTQNEITKKEIFKICPELKISLGSPQTRSGTPVVMQFLGSDGDLIAENILNAYELGARQFDLNFGCPAKTVNRHEGGAVLLQWPERLFQITSTIRKQIPADASLSAKMRLGYLDKNLKIENALALEAGKIDWLTIHARTKKDGYTPPAYWQDIAEIRSHLQIPIVANGDIFNLQDLLTCQRVTGCQDFMIGRGALRNPFLFKDIKEQKMTPFEEVKPWILKFFVSSSLFKSEYFAQARTKQFLSQLKFNFVGAQDLFERLKTITDPKEFKKILWQELGPAPTFTDLMEIYQVYVPTDYKKD